MPKNMSGRQHEKLQKIKTKRWVQQDGRCIHCGVEMVPVEQALGHSHLKDVMVTIEHMMPRHMGGTNEMSNIWLACNRCNLVRNEGYWGSQEREAGVFMVADYSKAVVRKRVVNDGEFEALTWADLFPPLNGNGAGHVANEEREP